MIAGAVLIFTFKAGMVLLALLLVYRLLLAGDRQPEFSRMVLLAFYIVAPAAVLLSEIDYDGNAVATEHGGIADVESILLLSVDGAEVTGVAGNSPVWAVALIAIWIAGMAATGMMTLICWLRIRKLLRGGAHVMYRGNRVVIIDNADIAPFSVRNTIVMNRKDYEEAADIILLHELRHIERRHWIDLCVSRIAIILCWYNPATWLMSDELRTVHEYQADAAVLDAGVDARLYQMLLIKKAVGRSFPAIANSLNHSNLKKRITMMLKTKQSKGRRWRALALAPAAVAVLMAGNIPAVANVMATVSSASLPVVSDGKVTQKTSESQTEKLTQEDVSRDVTTTTTYNRKSKDNMSVNTSTTVMVNGDIIDIKDTPKFYLNGKEVTANELANADVTKITEIKVDRSSDQPSINITLEEEKAEKNDTHVILPHFKGGEDKMWKWLGDNIKFPDTDAAKKIKDKVKVVVQFTVTAEGKITDAELIRSSELTEFNNEALRVVRLMPDFVPAMQDGKPISATYALPIVFKAM